MKTTKLPVTEILAAISLALTCISSHAQYVTNFMAYNFDTNQVTGIWTGFGADFVSVQWDPTEDSSNNPASGSMKLEVNYQGGQYFLWDGAMPSYSPLPLIGIISFTNLQFDVKYYSTAPGLIRTNVSPWDFGDARIGTIEPSYVQDWYSYYAVPATNSLGQPNTNWVHISVNLSLLPIAIPFYEIFNTVFAQDDANYGNNVLSGTQFIWFDNIQYIGWVSPVPPPTLSIQAASQGLQLFPGAGIYGRSQLQISTNYLNDGWIGPGTTYPASYAFTVNDNATTPGGLDTHLTFLPSTFDTGYPGYSGEDYAGPDTLWLQIISGSGTNTSCVANFSWKTNAMGCNPNFPTTNSLGQYEGGVVLWFTNSVRAGTWTVTFNSDVSGTIACPGTNSTGLNPIPFNLSAPTLASVPAGNVLAPPLSSAGADTNFANPMVVRFGDMNYGNQNRSQPDQWNNISVSGTAGTNFTVDFTKQGFNTNTMPSGLDPNLWDLTSSDGGATVTIQVPTNAPYWVNWNTPDAGWNNLCAATNVLGPWKLDSYYNGYGDGTNASGEYVIGTQTAHNGVKWNLMLPQYLPTANGLSNNPTPPTYPYNLSPDAFFRLTTDTNTPPL